MLSEKALARLAQLNRSPLADVPPVRDLDPRPEPDEESASARGAIARPRESWSDRDDDARLHGVRLKLAMGNEVQTAWGPYWEIRMPLQRIWPRCGDSIERTRGTLEVSSPAHEHRDLAVARRWFPDGALLLDLETCGLAGAAIFLVGVICVTDGTLELRQLWARDYSEEKAILQAAWSLCHPRPMLVTFNGKSFDWPLVHDRSTLHHLGHRALRPANVESSVSGLPEAWTRTTPRPAPHHFDLLHHARRRWRGQVPNFKLQTLERYLCGRHRVDDLPGSEIPGVYHDYVRHGATTQADDILHHNALDLVTSTQLMLRLLAD